MGKLRHHCICATVEGMAYLFPDSYPSAPSPVLDMILVLLFAIVY